MAFIYTQTNLRSKINAGVQGKIDILLDDTETMNGAVRDVLANVDMRSNLRRSALSPNLFNGIFPYLCPADLKYYSIVDIPAQAKRSDGEWFLVPPEEFDRKDGSKHGMMAIDDYEGKRVLKLSSAVDSKSVTISELDSTTSGGGTWAAFGDASNLAADNADYVKGNGSLKFDLSAAGGTTAGIVNSAVSTIDMTDYFGGTSSFFVWVKINSATNLTNYILRFGTDSSNYYSKTVTTQSDGTAFVAGWNLLMFNVSSYSTTGTPTVASMKYFAIYMTKTAGKISETDYKFDWLVLKKGVIDYVKYYSNYGWQTSAGAYILNSTTTTDLLVADDGEFQIFAKQGIVNARKEIGFPLTEISQSEVDLEKSIKDYIMQNPSQSKIMTNEYYIY